MSTFTWFENFDGDTWVGHAPPVENDVYGIVRKVRHENRYIAIINRSLDVEFFNTLDEAKLYIESIHSLESS
jgi:hypothetical protein